MVWSRPKAARGDLRRPGRPGAARCDRHRREPRLGARPRSPPREYRLLSKRTRQVLATEAGVGVEAVESGRHRGQARPFGFERLEDRPVPELRMSVGPGIGDALVEEPGFHLLVALQPDPRGEEALPDQPYLVLDLSLLPGPMPACRRQGRRDSGAHLLEAAMVGRSLPRRSSSTAVFMLS